MIQFPAALDVFWDRLLIRSCVFDDPAPVAFTRTAKGQAWTTDIGDQLWTGTITLAVMTARERADAEVLMSVLRPGGRTFLAYDRRRPAPLADPAGRILGATVPVIDAIPNPRELRLSGLPARYVLTRGDYLAYSRPGGGRALHQVVDTLVIASEAGLTPTFEVNPPVPADAVTGAAVSLVKPALKAMFVPDSVTKSETRHTISDGAQFTFIQTLY
jgi:hypothetical protein